MLFTESIFWYFYISVISLIKINFVWIKSIRLQNIILLISSYFFYSYWDWRFLSLIILVSFQTFIFGKVLNSRISYRRAYLLGSVGINILVLAYFKYYNFFASEFLKLIGLNESFTLEKVILPVGISFYIFQSMTYVIDIYLRKIKPETNIVNYFTYISFFPQLVAGPIERASSLLPQFNKLHNITKRNLYSGLKLVIIGLFLKVVIADNLGVYVDRIFKTYEDLNGGSLLLGAISFAIQIYGDFCGYSLIAIGVAKIMGFVLMENFDTPYFSTSIQQFWKRWHISLSSFFKDYIYIPLGGSRVQNKYLAARNILVTFFVSGIWHGANWTFILWGSIHGFLLVIQRNINVKIPKILSWILTISVVLLLWVLFRSETIPDAFIYLSKIFREFDIPDIGKGTMIYFFYFLVVDLLLSYYKKIDEIWFGKYFFQNYILFFMLVLVLGSNSANSNFIYFEF